MSVQWKDHRSAESSGGQFLEDQNPLVLPRIVKEAAREFSEIVFSEELCLRWALAWSKLVPDQLFRAGEWRKDRQHLQETCIALAIRSICLLSKQSSSPELASFLRVCREARLFFRGDQEALGRLYDEMSPVDHLDDLHPFQIAPPSPFDHWPEGHYLSWGPSMSIARGIIGDTPISFDADTGLSEHVLPPERISRKDWKGLLKSLKKMALHVTGFRSTSSGPLGKRSNFEGSSLVELDGPFTVVNLIRGGFNPFAVLDTSQGDDWQEGAKSVHYFSYIHLACSFGTSEVLRALMQLDIEEFRRRYAALDEQDEDTPYRRAVMNQRHPSVLIPLLEEAEVDREGRLAMEIAKWSNRMERPQCVPFDMDRVFSGNEWRNYTDNYLMLAAVGGDLKWAVYLVEQKERKAMDAHMAFCPEATKEQCLLVAFDAASSFVNRRTVFGGPSGTPVEEALKAGHSNVAKFLCDKGAIASLEIRMQALGRTIERNETVIDLWGQIQQQISFEIERMPLKATEDQIEEIVGIIMACRNYYEKQAEMAQSIAEVIDANDQAISRIEALLDLKEKNYRPIVEYYYGARNLLASHSLASSELRSRV